MIYGCVGEMECRKEEGECFDVGCCGGRSDGEEGEDLRGGGGVNEERDWGEGCWGVEREGEGR